MTVKTMDPDKKKIIANEKRLKAVRQWKKNKTVKNIPIKNTHIVFEAGDSVISNNGQEKPKLFDSEEEEETFEDSFKSRPQFDGPHGEQMLEMSSQFSGRFKLDERFREDEPEEEQMESQASEANKNIQILQSVLGYSISSKSAEKRNPKKRQIRFDPEDENASKYIKSEKPESSKPKKKKKDKPLEQVDVKPSLPISSERYIEVSSDLKEILSEPAAPFSLSQKFSQTADYIVPDQERFNGKYDWNEYKVETIESAEKKIEEKKETDLGSSSRDTAHQTQRESFFFKEGDPRLKEGIEFFIRPKSLDEIRIEWNRRRERILEVFRRRKRSMDRASSTKNRSQPNRFFRSKRF